MGLGRRGGLKQKLPSPKGREFFFPRYHPSCPAPTKGAPLPATHDRRVLITEDDSGRVYWAWHKPKPAPHRSVGGSGGIFGPAPAPGSHLFRTLWSGTPRLLVSIVAFC